MGNRDALLTGARRCLEDKGYAATTARDVASASGVSLSAIGYHFGTTQALLRQVIFTGIREWGAALEHSLADDAKGARDPTSVWSRVLDSFAGHRGVLASSFELLVHADRDPEVRQELATAIDHARRGLATQLGGIDPDTHPDRAARLGAYYYALLSGLMTQWLVDPDALPTSEELTTAMGEGPQLPTPPPVH